MSSNPDYQSVLKQVSAWPPEDRVALAQDLLGSIQSAAAPGPPPRDTLRRAIGLARGPGPVPNDVDVRQWLDEHRSQKYGQ